MGFGSCDSSASTVRVGSTKPLHVRQSTKLVALDKDAVPPRAPAEVAQVFMNRLSAMCWRLLSCGAPGKVRTARARRL